MSYRDEYVSGPVIKLFILADWEDVDNISKAKILFSKWSTRKTHLAHMAANLETIPALHKLVSEGGILLS